MADPVLELVGIQKRFGDKIALHSIDLEIESGTVHVICGENGAGKSTLMNILAGIYRPDAGEILIEGRSVAIPDPISASRFGIGMVHQHFTLAPSMTVAENIFLGRLPRRLGLFTDRSATRRRATEIIARSGFSLDPDARVADLSVGQRQRVEIVKALAFDARILILDEPSAVLTPREVDELIEVIRGLRDRGRAIVFITHKLSEVKAVADAVTVIRDGRSVATFQAPNISEIEIAKAMVGREVFLRGRDRTATGTRVFGPTVIGVSGVTVVAPGGRLALDRIAFDVQAGEVLGIAGVDGNGQTELAESIAGLRRIEAGAIRIAGIDVAQSSVADRRRAGLGFIPEDRMDRGLSASMSVAETVAATNYRDAGLVRNGLISPTLRDRYAASKIKEFDVRGARPSTPVGWLSGGNMQKVVIARELAHDLKVLIVAQPTRGLDIGASEFVQQEILRAADRGCAVLLISSELSEIFALSDRIGVMFHGRLVAIRGRDRTDENEIGLFMSGGGLEQPA
jgi:simple sugar transport system ATP-binding protein